MERCGQWAGATRTSGSEKRAVVQGGVERRGGGLAGDDAARLGCAHGAEIGAEQRELVAGRRGGRGVGGGRATEQVEGGGGWGGPPPPPWGVPPLGGLRGGGGGAPPPPPETLRDARVDRNAALWFSSGWVRCTTRAAPPTARGAVQPAPARRRIRRGAASIAPDGPRLVATTGPRSGARPPRSIRPTRRSASPSVRRSTTAIGLRGSRRGSRHRSHPMTAPMTAGTRASDQTPATISISTAGVSSSSRVAGVRPAV